MSNVAKLATSQTNDGSESSEASQNVYSDIKDCPMRSTSKLNESNFEKINLWQIIHANGNTKISSVETSIAKELVLVILWL